MTTKKTFDNTVTNTVTKNKEKLIRCQALLDAMEAIRIEMESDTSIQNKWQWGMIRAAEVIKKLIDESIEK